VHEEIARFRGAGGGNFIEEVAAPIPAIVIARLLGVPEKDHDRFRHWSDEVMTLVFANVDDPRRHERAHVGLLALEGYFRALLDERLANPRADLLTALARAEEAGDRLSSDEVIATCILLLFAGHETTTSLLGTGLLALLRNPDEWAALRDDPALAASAVEEFLRYDGPQKVMMRFVADDLELRGKRLRRGERVLLIGAAANRDPEVFPEPDRLDLDRSPNEHLGFGYGIHYCLGAPLARMEGRLAFAAIARELPNIRLAGPAPEWHRTIVSRGLRSFPVAV
jgi:cytochrome P450